MARQGAEGGYIASKREDLDGFGGGGILIFCRWQREYFAEDKICVLAL